MPDRNAQPGGIKAEVGEEFRPPQFEAHALGLESRRDRQDWILLAIAGGVLAVILIEPLVVRAELITPISGYALWPMRAFGLMTGLALVISTPRDGRVDWKGRLRGAVSLVVGCAVGAALADALTWRAARFLEFGLSDQPFVAATYPLTAGWDGRLVGKGQIRIDPFGTGQPLVIRIAPGQLGYGLAPQLPLCITVMQRRSASGAIEVQTEPWRPFETPSVKKIQPCPQGSPDHRNSFPAA